METMLYVQLPAYVYQLSARQGVSQSGQLLVTWPISTTGQSSNCESIDSKFGVVSVIPDYILETSWIQRK